MRGSVALEDASPTSFHWLIGDHDAPDEGDAHFTEEAAKENELKCQARMARANYLQVNPISLLLYIMLVVLLSAVVVLSRDGEYDYYLASMVRELVLGSEFDTSDTEIARTFEDVRSLEDVYMFLRGPLLAALCAYLCGSFPCRP